ncbi:visual pigment-like receptor peropsin [Pomacea canaliculata]|uniref:visual pigment-like receptor peropsin n=1 Tax=Pomacea canaliculata TaxID=400727 RepID=UPI000D73AB2A|nr:visual pigment-like receptor peropsin [Pomacea canaliculata]XP_025088975.1 visual pigment-like receptor peropsin [Pomacea canaliculata]XP_025088976.1 visual pigment-like receptor peropsin [Pomacea canaliculata]
MNCCNLEINSTSGSLSSHFKVFLSGDEYTGLGVYLLLTGMFGFFGNIVALVMFVRDNQFRSTVDMLLVNLAFADIGMCGLCFPFVSASNFAQRWLFGESGCTAYGFAGFLFGNTTIFTLSAISVQRYLVVCKRWPNVRNINTLVTVVMTTWFQALLWSSLPLLLPKPYDLEPFGTSCTVSWASDHHGTKIFVRSLVAWVTLHFLVMAFCYTHIYVCSRRALTKVSSRSYQDLLVSKICFILVTAFAICWSPYMILSSLSLSSLSEAWPLLSALPVMMAKLSSCVNPVLYILVSRRFRQRYLETITCRRRTDSKDLGVPSIHVNVTSGSNVTVIP